MPKLNWLNMNCKNKKSFSIIEILLSIFIISMLTIYTMLFYKDIFLLNEDINEQEILKLELLNTKFFLEKNKNFNGLKIEDSILYINDNILLKNVTKYKIQNSINYKKLTICLKNIICQEMVFKI